MKKKEMFVFPDKEYNHSIIKVVKRVSKEVKHPLYITLNKTHDAVREMLGKNKIQKSKFCYIDFISTTLFKDKKNGDCFYLNSLTIPGSLVHKIEEVVKKRHNVDAIILDSLSSLLVYKANQHALIIMQHLMSFCEEKEIDLYIFVMNKDKQNNAVKQLQMRVDKTTKVKK